MAGGIGYTDGELVDITHETWAGAWHEFRFCRRACGFYSIADGGKVYVSLLVCIGDRATYRVRKR